MVVTFLLVWCPNSGGTSSSTRLLPGLHSRPCSCRRCGTAQHVGGQDPREVSLLQTRAKYSAPVYCHGTVQKLLQQRDCCLEPKLRHIWSWRRPSWRCCCPTPRCPSPRCYAVELASGSHRLLMLTGVCMWLVTRADPVGRRKQACSFEADVAYAAYADLRKSRPLASRPLAPDLHVHTGNLIHLSQRVCLLVCSAHLHLLLLDTVGARHAAFSELGGALRLASDRGGGCKR